MGFEDYEDLIYLQHFLAEAEAEEQREKYYVCEEEWPDPCANAEWKGLIQDPKWQYVPNANANGNCYYGTVKNGARWDIQAEIIAHSANGLDMHAGALAPKWVFEKNATTIPTEEQDSMDTYMKRLICAVTGRFVYMGNDFLGENFVKGKGIPEVGERYRWRYWDNDGNVYDDIAIKWTSYPFEHPTSGDMDASSMEYWGSLPGDFRKGRHTWMCISQETSSMIGFGMTSIFGFGSTISMQREGGAITREFWDNIWAWKFNGSTNSSQWDQRLVQLAKTAGVSVGSLDSKWAFRESELDSVAIPKGWTKLECKQPAMASYKKDDARLNFYLTTGTVGSSLNHTKKGKTQLFRRKVSDFSALFDNPRTHTGKGYYTVNETGKVSSGKSKKRKRDNSQVSTHCCASCRKDKNIGDFSKNQLRKRSLGRCKVCVDRSLH